MAAKPSWKLYYWIGSLVAFLCIVWVSFWFATHPFQEGMTGDAVSWYDFVDVIYYINLDHREDRKQSILDELKKTGVPDTKIVRISGEYKPGQGDWGCSLSHVKAMQQFVESSHQNCVIFEDDFVFTQSPGEINTVYQDFFQAGIAYDVCMLSSNEIRTEPTQYTFINKVLDAQTASGYMVNKAYAPTLYANFQEGAQKIGESYQRGKGDDIQGPFCVDQYWKRLQPSGNWYVFTPKLGKQSVSFSDIQGGVVDSGV